MSSPTPKDEALYKKVKAYVYKKYPIHSAYRSGRLVTLYKKRYLKKYDNDDAYIGKKPEMSKLQRWFKEDWKSDTGKYRYTSKSSVYRPSKRITKDTPLTFSELTQKELRRAKRQKAKKGRVYRFRSK
jgi:hypothetical protein